MKYLNLERLKQQATDYKEAYQKNVPFPHIVIDNFLDNLEEVYSVFPEGNHFKFYEYNNPLEKKLAFDQVSKLPKEIADLMMEMSSADFLLFLEDLTGIEGLVPDPYFRGGGVHQSKRGGKLDMHVDFNIHPKLKLERRLNAIVYLNKNWQESWHGDLQLWEGYKENGKHVLVKMQQKIYPIFNRLVIFSTSEKSYHGHPEPMECPEDVTRNSMALYYYTKERPENDRYDPHSTTYIKLPWEDDSLDELREKRNKGRLNSNIQEKGLQ
jgi:Rps23 Pro-64 3,4-dihydroxylase Tpa1-like proline 4-hydroxylase